MTPWEEPDPSQGTGQAGMLHRMHLQRVSAPCWPPTSSSPTPTHRCRDGRTPVLWLGCLARGLEFTEHSPACCGNSSAGGAGGEPACGEQGVCLGGEPSQGSSRRGVPVGLVSLPLLCPGVRGGLCLGTNTVCLGEGFLPHAQPLLSLDTDSPRPLCPTPDSCLV